MIDPVWISLRTGRKPKVKAANLVVEDWGWSLESPVCWRITPGDVITGGSIFFRNEPLGVIFTLERETFPAHKCDFNTKIRYTLNSLDVPYDTNDLFFMAGKKGPLSGPLVTLPRR